MKKRILSLVLAVLMIVSILPAPTHAADVTEETTQKHPMMGELVAINFVNSKYYDNPGTYGNFIASSYFADRMEIVAVDESTGTTYYQVNAAPGCSWKADSLGNVLLFDGIWVKASDTIHLVYCEDCKEYNCGIDHEPSAEGECIITDANGNVIDPSAGVSFVQYSKLELNAQSALEGTVSYQWQIEYEEGKWVDIYGEDSRTVNLSYGMVASLLNDDGMVNIRCRSTSGSAVSYSAIIPVTMEMYTLEKPDVVVTESCVTSSGETVYVTLAGTLPEDGFVTMEETDADDVEVRPTETVVAALDIAVLNLNGTPWQPESGETVTIALEASKLGMKDGQRYVVYHQHNGVVTALGAYDVADGIIKFVVDGFSKFVFTELEMLTTTEDLQADVTKKATINDERYTNLWLVKSPETVTAYTGQWYVQANEGVDYAKGIEFDITAAYVSAVYPYGVFYKVEAVNSEELLTDVLEKNPWVFQRYQDEPVEDGTLILQESEGPELPEIPEAPDFSSHIGKHAHLTQSDTVFTLVLDEEPSADNIDNSTVYMITDFSTDFTLKIDGYKVVAEIDAVTSAETGEMINYLVTQSLWYKVSVVKGSSSKEFEDGWWVYQGYIINGDVLDGAFTLFDAPVDPEEPTDPSEPTDPTDPSEPTEPGEPSVGVTVDGQPVQEITVSTSEKVTLTATPNVEGTTTYQWQILISAANMWVNISGQNTAECTVNYGMVANALDAEGKAYIRCKTTVDGTEIISEPIAVLIGEDTVEATVQANSSSSGSDSAEDGEGTEGTIPSGQKYNFIVKFYLNNSDKEIYQQFVAEFTKGETRVLKIAIPERVGYSAWWVDVVTGEYTQVTDYSMEYTYTFNGTEDVVYAVRYTPNQVEYEVKHYFQNCYDDGYAEPVIEKKTGTADSALPDVHKTEEGFYNIPYIHPAIAPDGSTVIEIYYDRMYNLMTFDLGEGGYGVEPVYARYGTEVTLGTPERPGYVFNGWEYENGTDITAATVLMPAAAVKIVAKWTAGTASYTIVYWKENANPEEDGTYGYTYWTHRKVANSKPGEVVSGRDDVAAYVSDEAYFTFNDARTDKNVVVKGDGTTVVNVYYLRNTYTIYFYGGNSCGITEHTHGDGNCNSYLICGKAEHTHNEECGERVIGCGVKEHTEHTADCLACDEIEHTAHSNDCLICKSDENHIHTSDCCSIEEHKHSVNCCNAHTGLAALVHLGGRQDSCNTGRCNGKTEHTHGDANCACTKPANHTHSEAAGCYSDTLHTHSTSCYKDALHSHSDSCYTYPGCTGEAEHTHTEACYSECTLDEHTHGNRCPEDDDDQKVFLVVQAKYDADIASIWESKPVSTWLEDNYVFQSSKTSKYYSFLEKMPGYDIEMYATLWSGYTYTWYYYLEVLPGQDTTGLTTTTDNGKLYYRYHTTSVKANSLSLTDEEDYFPITGFTQRDKNVPSFSNYRASLYYVRNSYELSFNNAGVELTDKGGTYLFEQDISKTYFEPEYPENFEKNAYEFAGWYTTPDCFDGTEFSFEGATMPAEDVALFAKWTPVTHTVKIYLDDTLSTQIGATQRILHNNYAEKPKNDPTNGAMEFLGWFYKDENGEEKAFSFDTQIKYDLNLYAKWRNTAIINYEIRYIGIDSSGKQFQIAATTVGQQYADKTMTFEPKGTEEYFAEYQSAGYFAMTAAHSIDMGEENCQTGSENCTWDPETKTHTFTFYYELGPVVPYTVRYYYEGTTTPVFKNSDGSEYFDTYPDNRKSVVIANAKGQVGYKADEVQKSLVVIKGQINEIIFYYSKDEKATYYEVIHHLVDKDGKELASDTLTYNANIGEVVQSGSATVAPLKYDGFTFDEDYVGTLRQGTATNNPILQLHLYYVENQVTLKYQVVGGETGGGTVSVSEETLGASYGVAKGSKATPNSSVYKFVGWYSHWDCKEDQLLSTDPDYTPTKADTALWVDGTTYYAKFEYNLTSLTIKKVTTDKNGNVVDYSEIDPNQSFIFDIYDGSALVATVTVNSATGWKVVVDGLTVGKHYTVTERTDWSWRYNCTGWEYKGDNGTVAGENATASITLGLNATVTFTNTRGNEQWLDGDSWCNNIFK